MDEALGLIEANWLIFAAAALLVLLVTWWLLSRSAKSNRSRAYKPDVLDEGVGPAQRNQALIDAAPAANVIMPPMASNALGGLGEIIAVAAQDEVEEARAAQVVPPPPPPPPPPPAAAEPVQQPVIEVLAEPVEIPGLDEAASPERTESEVQQPDAVLGAAPEPELVTAPAPANGSADDLARIKGLGPKLQALLPTLGITTFAQIAAMTEADLAALDPQLGPFAGRPTRDGWVEQAQYLAAGDTAGFEARFGKV